MKPSVVDLRYKSSDIIKALERNESVTILYHGKVKGVINPVTPKKLIKVSDHPFFGMNAVTEKTVSEEMQELRGGRYNL